METTIKTREELYQWLNEHKYNEREDSKSLESSYVLIQHGDIVEPLYFMSFRGSYFESPCILHEIGKEDDVEQYVTDLYETDAVGAAMEYEKMMCIDGIHYEIDNFQCEPFLEMPCTIIKIMKEKETLEWLLQAYATMKDEEN